MRNYDTFGIVEDEGPKRLAQLKEIDKEVEATGELYVECPRCESTRQIEVIIRMNGTFFAPKTEMVNCPCCGGMGEACREAAEKWLLETIEEIGGLSDEDEDYIENRKMIVSE